MKLKALIKCLEKDKAEFHEQEVEYVICTKKGQILAMNVEGNSDDMRKALSLFSTKIREA